MASRLRFDPCRLPAETEELLRLRPRETELDALTVFLERVTLITDLDGWEQRPDRISLMTLHSSKGLEFDRVIIAGVEAGYLPHSRSDVPDSEDEERRLLYVGITRAQRSLTLTHASSRSRFGTRSESMVSRFVFEARGVPSARSRTETFGAGA